MALDLASTRATRPDRYKTDTVEDGYCRLLQVLMVCTLINNKGTQNTPPVQSWHIYSCCALPSFRRPDKNKSTVNTKQTNSLVTDLCKTRTNIKHFVRLLTYFKRYQVHTPQADSTFYTFHAACLQIHESLHFSSTNPW